MAAFPAGTPPLNRRSPGGKITKAYRIPPLERRTVPDNMRLLQPRNLLQIFFHLGLVAFAGMSHPFPSRTRPLSSPVAMILRSRAWESSALPVLFLSPGPVGNNTDRPRAFFIRAVGRDGLLGRARRSGPRGWPRGILPHAKTRRREEDKEKGRRVLPLGGNSRRR